MHVLPAEHPRQNKDLDDSPIGRLAVIEWADTLCVAVMHPHDPTKLVRVIHQLQPGENPLQAVYGKRVLEDAVAGRMYRKRDELRTTAMQRTDADIRKDFRRELRKILNKEDGRDAVGWMFTHKKQGAA